MSQTIIEQLRDLEDAQGIIARARIDATYIKPAWEMLFNAQDYLKKQTIPLAEQITADTEETFRQMDAMRTYYASERGC